MTSLPLTEVLDNLRKLESTVSMWTTQEISIDDNHNNTFEQILTVCRSVLNVLEDLSSGGEDDSSSENSSDNVSHCVNCA